MLDPPSLDADDAQSDDEDDSQLDTWVGKAQLLKLMEFCALKSKSDMVKAVLCPGAFDGAGDHLRCLPTPTGPPPPENHLTYHHLPPRGR